MDQQTQNQFTISTDKTRLDVGVVHDYLCNESYWARGRSLEDVKTSIENSVCFGMYDDAGKMVGFARVLTDKVVFAYLMDVFILEPYQGKGLGTRLMKHILEHPDFKVIRRFLGTVSAHDFYRRLGFTDMAHPERFMEMVDPDYLAHLARIAGSKGD